MWRMCPSAPSSSRSCPRPDASLAAVAGAPPSASAASVRTADRRTDRLTVTPPVAGTEVNAAGRMPRRRVATRSAPFGGRRTALELRGAVDVSTIVAGVAQHGDDLVVVGDHDADLRMGVAGGL